jgi:hypothetical protein
MMIKVSALEQGLLLLSCSECAWRSQWAAVPDLSITKIIDDAMFHAERHGVDELRGDRDFSRPGGGQDTRRPVLSLPPGPIASNSSDSLTERDDHDGHTPFDLCCDPRDSWPGY